GPFYLHNTPCTDDRIIEPHRERHVLFTITIHARQVQKRRIKQSFILFPGSLAGIAPARKKNQKNGSKQHVFHTIESTILYLIPVIFSAISAKTFPSIFHNAQYFSVILQHAGTTANN